jgi:hypothetical protein
MGIDVTPFSPKNPGMGYKWTATGVLDPTTWPTIYDGYQPNLILQNPTSSLNFQFRRAFLHRIFIGFQGWCDF